MNCRVKRFLSRLMAGARAGRVQTARPDPSGKVTSFVGERRQYPIESRGALGNKTFVVFITKITNISVVSISSHHKLCLELVVAGLHRRRSAASTPILFVQDLQPSGVTHPLHELCSKANANARSTLRLTRATPQTAISFSLTPQP
jgi:hypothetical protein